MNLSLKNVVAFIFFIVAPNLVQAEMQTGIWEVNSNLKMNDVDLTGTANKHKTCMTHKAMKHFLKSATNGMKRNGKGCKLINQKETVDSYSWKMQCDSLLGMPGNVTGTGNFKLNKKFVSGEMKFINKILNTKVLSLSLVNRIEAKRLGNCKKKTNKSE